MQNNTCDKCTVLYPTSCLVWITSEDFAPKKDEYIPEELYNKYDALCEDCYILEVDVLVLNK